MYTFDSLSVSLLAPLHSSFHCGGNGASFFATRGAITLAISHRSGSLQKLAFLPCRMCIQPRVLLDSLVWSSTVVGSEHG